MAEVVQFRTEQTISELEQMQRIGLFSKEEIRLIAAKRKRYEYKMQRLVKGKDIFLRFIQYELDLIRLIKLRRKKTKITFKVEEIEHEITNRICRLFNQALSRHRNDLKLWISYIRCCMQWGFKSNISGILVRMLSVHNNKVKVWKFAANWEFRENDSIETARKLMLRGLRFHPKSKSLYKAYLAMELEYADNKRRILEERDNLENDLIQAEIGLMKKKLQFADVKTRNSIKIAVQKKLETIAEKPKHELKTKLAEIIFDSALIRFQNLQTFVEIFAVVKAVKGTGPLQKKFLQQLHQRFPSNELVFDLEAMLTLDESSGRKSIAAAYSNALEQLPTEKMWSLYLEALMSNEENPRKSKSHFLRQELDKCHRLGLLNVKFYPKLVTLLLNVKDSRAKTILLRRIELDPKNADLHLLHVKIQLTDGNEESVLNAFKKAETELGNDNMDMLELYKTIVQHYENIDFGLADKFFMKSIFAGPNISSTLKPCYLQWVYDKKGLQEVRDEYKSLILVPPRCLKLHEKMIDLEMAQPEIVVRNVRFCHDLAAFEFGEINTDVWLKFIAFELRKGDPKLVPLIFSHAKARLEDDLLDGFITRYTLDRANGKV